MFLAILYKNVAFLLLCGSTEGTPYGRPKGLPWSQKKWGVPYGHALQGASPRKIIKN